MSGLCHSLSRDDLFSTKKMRTENHISSSKKNPSIITEKAVLSLCNYRHFKLGSVSMCGSNSLLLSISSMKGAMTLTYDPSSAAIQNG